MSFDELRTNGWSNENSSIVPFVVSLSNHAQDFFNTLL
jgi:hypothetical protein